MRTTIMKMVWLGIEIKLITYPIWMAAETVGGR